MILGAGDSVISFSFNYIVFIHLDVEKPFSYSRMGTVLPLNSCRFRWLVIEDHGFIIKVGPTAI